MIEKLPGPPGVLGRDDGDLAQHPGRALGQVLEVAERRGDDE
jgi:hypothetical protein